jgi:hypothetical protein
MASTGKGRAQREARVPSQICHILFADESLRRGLAVGEEERLGPHLALFRFAAQGPDFFYHNGFSRPSGRTFGALMHRRRIGLVVRRLAEDAAERGDAALEAFAMGFATHAFLDRAAHPFIDYFGGWEDPADPATRRYYRCHAFFERILDVLMLQRRLGMAAEDYGAASLLDCGEELPASVVEALAGAIRSAFPGMDMTADGEARVRNAYRDARGFYRFTSRAEFRKQAVVHDRAGPDRRRLALFHPDALPTDIDFLNLEHRLWTHPCDDGAASTASFPQLFEQAIDPAAAAVAAVAAVAEGAPGAAVEALVGNHGLNTETPGGGRRRYRAPLPLPELLESLYSREA